MTRLLLDVDTGIDDALALAYLASPARRGVRRCHGVAGERGCAPGGAKHLGHAGAVRAHRGGGAPSGAEGPLAVPLVTTPETHGPQGIGYADLPPPIRDGLGAARRRRVGGGGPGEPRGADGPALRRR